MWQNKHGLAAQDGDSEKNGPVDHQCDKLLFLNFILSVGNKIISEEISSYQFNMIYSPENGFFSQYKIHWLTVQVMQ